MDTRFHRSAAPGLLPGLTNPARILTPRDRDIIALVLAGHTNAEIARRLEIQLQTLKNSLSSVYDKLGVSTRLQLAVMLLRDRVNPVPPAGHGMLTDDVASCPPGTPIGDARL